MAVSCQQTKINSGKKCYRPKVRHKQCGNIGCDSKGDCPSSLMDSVGRCKGCDKPIYIGDTEWI